VRRGGRNEEIDIDIRDGRRRDDIEVDFREEQYNRARPRQRDMEEIDIDIRRDKNRGRRDYDQEIDVDIRRESPQGRHADKDEVDVNIKRSARSQSRPRIVAREREEFIYKRREPSPIPQREIEEIIIRRPRTPSPTVSSISSRSPTPEPEPEPELEPIRRPPIIQEIITHHRHIDHGIKTSHNKLARTNVVDLRCRQGSTHGSIIFIIIFAFTSACQAQEKRPGD